MVLSVVLAVLGAILIGVIVLQAVSARSVRSENRALQERVRRYKLALTAGGDELWQYDLSTDQLTREIQTLEFVDANAEPYVPLGRYLESVHPDDRHLIEEAMRAMTSAATDVFEVSYRAQRRDGSWAWLDSYARVATRDPSGKPPLVVGTTRNVTALRTTAERLKLALSSASEEVWEVDFVADRLHRENPLMQIEHDGYRSAREEFARLVHPEDFPLVRQAFFAVRSGKTSDFHALYRLRTKSGHYVWMESQASTTDFDAAGKPRRLVGMSRDVTALKESQDRLRLVLWGSDLELWDTDMTTGAIHRNNLLPNLTINAHGETILFSALLAEVHPDDEPSLRQSVYAHAKGETEAHEAWFRLPTASGSWRWIYVRGRVTERAESGWATRMTGIMHDITSVKQTEEELKRLNEELEDRVASRTAALSLANTELSQTIGRLGEAQTRLVESEKMASLGSLVAGVAHEINTPIGVSVTAASHLDEEIQRFEARLQTNPSDDAAQLRKSAGIIRQCADLIMRNLDRADKLVKNFKQVAVDQSSEQSREIVLKDYFDEILTSLNPRLK
ncbi:MAG TPA: PAS domain-containing protein, partial [Xanthomonadaceae bacterium]|nr:PAS domain-containing protein [Xanthomonadaceae bacterium]